MSFRTTLCHSIAGLCSCAAVACGGYSKTLRVVDGKPIDERPISSSAYAAYAYAAQLEGNGKLELALTAYREALGFDSESVEIQTRIASLTCQLAPDDANPEFEDAQELDGNYEALWREWALCELRRGNLTRALRMAKRGVEAAPDGLEASMTVVRVYEARKEPELALRQLVAYTVRFRDSREAWSELYHLARRQRDDAWLREAAQQVDRLTRKDAPIPALGDTPEQIVGRILLAEGLTPARNAAVEFRLGATDLGWLAVALGRPKEALAQAELVLGADPDNLEAIVLALTASHQADRSAAFREQLAKTPVGDVNDLSPRAREALVHLLEARVSEESARLVQQLMEHGPRGDAAE